MEMVGVGFAFMLIFLPFTMPSFILARHGRWLVLAAGLAALAAIATMIAIAWKIFQGARLSFEKFGISFLWNTVWDPVKGVFGAGSLVDGTAATCAIALLVGAPLAIAIGLYLSELAPRGVRGVIGTLVEMLAAIPSVVLGLWGILVMAPFLGQHVEPWLHRHLGFIPIFGGSPQEADRRPDPRHHGRADHRQHLP